MLMLIFFLKWRQYGILHQLKQLEVVADNVCSNHNKEQVIPSLAIEKKITFKLKDRSILPKTTPLTKPLFRWTEIVKYYFKLSPKERVTFFFCRHLVFAEGVTL